MAQVPNANEVGEQAQGFTEPTRSPAQDFTDDIRNIGSGDRQLLEQTRYLAKERTPEVAARVYDASKKTALPVDFVADNLDEVEKEASDDGYNLRKFARKSPNLAKWMAKNPNNFALIKPDLSNEEKFNDIIDDYGWSDSLRDSLIGGVSKYALGVARNPSFMFESSPGVQAINLGAKLLDSDFRVKAPDILKNNSITGFVEQAMDEANKRNPYADGEIIDRLFSGDLDGAGKAAAGVIVANSPQLLTTVLGGPVGLAMIAQNVAANKSQELQKQGVDITTAIPNAILSGGIEAATEKMGTLGIINRWQKDIVAKFGQQTFNQLMKSAGKNIAAAFITEGTEEVAAELGTAIVDQISGVNETALSELSPKVLANTFLAGGIAGAGYGPLSTIPIAVKSHQSKLFADSMVNKIVAMGKNMESSKLLQLNPEAWREKATAQLENTANEFVYIPVEALELKFQSEDVKYQGGLAKLIQDLDIAESFDQAKTTGGMVKIKTANFLSKIQPAGLLPTLSQDITFDLNKPTMNEAKAEIELAKAAQEEMRKVQSEGRSINDELDPESVIEAASKAKAINGRTPVEAVYEQLINIGYTPERARLNAITWRFFDTVSKRTGIPVDQIFNRYDLVIGRSVYDSRQKKIITRQDAELVSKSFADLKETGQSDEIAAQIEEIKAYESKPIGELGPEELKSTNRSPVTAAEKEAIVLMIRQVETESSSLMPGPDTRYDANNTPYGQMIRGGGFTLAEPFIKQVMDDFRVSRKDLQKLADAVEQGKKLTEKRTEVWNELVLGYRTNELDRLRSLIKEKNIDLKLSTEEIKQQLQAVESFDVNEDDIPFQKSKEKSLIIQHNLTAQNLLFANDLGGIPAPSLAITSADTPMANFGEITLLGSKDMADPKKGSKVFGSDIYSPRYPDTVYKFDKKSFKKITEFFSEQTAQTQDNFDQKEFEKDPVQYLLDKPFAMIKFLKSNGIEPNIKYKQPSESESAFIKKYGLEKFFGIQDYNLRSDQAFIKAVTEAQKKEWKAEYDKETAKEVIEEFSKNQGYRGRVIRDWSIAVENAGKQKKDFDYFDSRNSLRDQIKSLKLQTEFNQFLNDLIRLENPKVKIKKYTDYGDIKLIDHTLENVVKELKRGLRGGENFNYGVGNIRAKVTPQFKSIKEIKDEKGRLVSETTFDSIKDEINKELFALGDELKDYHSTKGEGFRYIDALTMMLGDAATVGIPKALVDNAFEGAGESQMKLISDFLDKLKTLPTAYFEAKLLRGVDLGEFKVAVLPESTDQKVKDILKNKGVELFEYDEKTNQSDAIKQAAKQFEETIMFQQQSPLGFYYKSEQIVSNKMGPTATVEQVRGMLKEVKPEELEWLGINEFLKGKEKVSKQELLDFIRANDLGIREIKNGENLSQKRLEDAENSFIVALRRQGMSESDAKDLALDIARGDKAYSEIPEGYPDSIQDLAIDLYTAYHDRQEVGDRPKFGQYVLPGGENYREVLFTLPQSFIEPELQKLSDTEWMIGGFKIVDTNGANYQVIKGATVYARRNSFGAALDWVKAEIENTTDQAYRSSHFNEPNILAHTRLNDRVDTDGKNVLFVEEIQSDWHQAGRKQGYKDTIKAKLLREELNKTEKPLSFPEWLNKELEGMYSLKQGEKIINTPSSERTQELNKLVEEYYAYANPLAAKREALRIEANNLENGVPNAPLKKTWHEFVLKRIIRMAAEQGYDRVAWTTGEQQNKRYPQLVELVNSIEWHSGPKNEGTKFVLIDSKRGGEINLEIDSTGSITSGPSDYMGKGLDSVIGKDPAKRIVEGGPTGILKDDGLSIGGSGMRGFYDKILVDYANKLGKKFGAKVQEKEIQGDGNRFYMSQNANDEWAVFERHGDSALGTEIQTFKHKTDAYLAKQELNKKGIPVHALDITPELEESALKQGFELFQQGGTKYRGAFWRDPVNQDKAFIQMLQDENASTFQHESAHFFLEVMMDLAEDPRATAEIRSDVQKIFKFIGVESRDQIQTEHHEKFAEAWEKYLMEGKAPSKSLIGAFETFRGWMIAIYKRITEQYPNLKMNDEIRGVFDRMLATDAEIAEVQGETRPMILEARGIMPDDEAKIYEQAIERERQLAEDELRGIAMKNISREAISKRQDARKEVTERITKQVMNEPEQIIYQTIKDTTEGKPSLKMDRALAEKLVTPEVMKKMPSGVFAKDGLHPDEAAMFLQTGKDGIDLLLTLANMEKAKDKIDRLVRSELELLFPDPTQMPDFNEKARAALHNEAGSERRMFELRYLANNAPEAKKLLARLWGRRYGSVDPYRNRAELIINSTKLKDISPSAFKRLEIKYANESMLAFKRGDWVKAVEMKALEITNYELYKIANKSRLEINSQISRFRRAFKSDEQISEIRDIDTVMAARALLGRVGFGNVKEDAFKAYLNKMADYDNMDDQVAVLNGLIDNANFKVDSIYDLTFVEFEQVKNSFNSLWAMAKELARVETVEGYENKQKAIDEMLVRIDEKTKNRVAKEYAGKPTDSEKKKNLLLRFIGASRRVEFFVDILDDGNPKGPFRKYFWQPIQMAADKFYVRKREVTKNIESLINEYKDIFKQGAIQTELVGLSDSSGKSGSKYVFENKSELLGAMLHTGNISNKMKLLVGNGWGSVDENGVLDSSFWDQHVAKWEREGVLTERDYQFLQKYWDVMESVKPEAQRAHKKIYGYYFQEITANEVVTSFGTFRGGYAPAVRDMDRVKDIGREKENLENGMAFANMFPSSSDGFTISRNPNYAQPLKMDLSLVLDHIDQVLRFSYITPAMKDVSKFIFDRKFRSALDSLSPDLTKEMIIPWLDRSVKQSVSQPSQFKAIDSVARTLRARVGAGTMFLNVVNAAQQFTGFLPASVKVPAKYLAFSMAQFIRNPKDFHKSITDKSVFMANRSSDQTATMIEGINKVLVNPTTFERWQEFGMKNAYVLQTATQNIVDSITWVGAYNQAIENGRSESEAILDADSSVRMTQGSMSPQDISSIEAGTPAMRLFTMFSSYFNTMANLLGAEGAKTLAKDIGVPKKSMKLAMLYASVVSIPAILSAIIIKLGAGEPLVDDDDEWFEVLAQYFGLESAKTTFAMVPFVGAVAPLVYSKFTKNQFDDRLNISPVISSLEGISSIGGLIGETAEGELKKKTVKDALSVMTIATGIPSFKAASRPVGYLMDVESGKAQPSGVIDMTRGLVTGRTPQQ